MRTLLWGLGAAAVLLAGCPAEPGGGGETGSATEAASSGGETACNPGETSDCACTDGTMGTQVCAEDGQSFGACECGAGTSGGQGGTGTTSDGDSTGDGTTGPAEGTTSEGETDAACLPGTIFTCDCPEGPGYQECSESGEIGPCICCEGSHPLVEGDLRYCEEGHCYCGDLMAMPPVDACFAQAIAEACCPGDIVLECY